MTRQDELVELKALLDGLPSEAHRVKVVREYLDACQSFGNLDALVEGIAVADVINLLSPASRLELTNERLTPQPEVPQEVAALVEALRANPKPFFGNIAHELA